jgi:hypothetical protein
VPKTFRRFSSLTLPVSIACRWTGLADLNRLLKTGDRSRSGGRAAARAFAIRLGRSKYARPQGYRVRAQGHRYDPHGRPTANDSYFNSLLEMLFPE